MKYTNETFIKKATEKYGNKYTYDKVNYINSQTKVCIICPEHGEFYVRPADYLRGYGCPKCSNIKRIKKLSLTQDEVIRRFHKAHDDKYDYSLVEYVNYDTKVKIICPIHGVFEMTPSNHIRGQGCPKCKGIHLTTKEIIDEFHKIHGDKYDYSKTVYNKMHEKITVICPRHGEFQITPSKHRIGQGCPKCGILKRAKNQSYDNESFIEILQKVHNGKYIYTKATLNGNLHNRITITCPIHGDFEQIAQSHLNGHGCPKCQSSHLEEEIKSFLNDNKIEFEQQKTFEWLKLKNHLYLDFYLPKYNKAIECQGIQHFKPVNFFGGEECFIKTIERDDIKQKLCENNGIKIIYFTNKNNCYNNSAIISLKELKEAILF